MNDDIASRLDTALQICRDAGRLALNKYRNLTELTVEKKGLQDLVSEADRDVEKLIRRCLMQAHPGDGIIGEEFDDQEMDGSPYRWVIDPIDGTANYVRGIPIWCVVLACVTRDETVIGVVYDPIHDEMFHASQNQGACLNGKIIRTVQSEGLHDGLTGIGTSLRTTDRQARGMITDLITQGGVFSRTGSGALGIVYAACGRYIGYLESHMNAWDCLAAMLIAKEAGGRVIDFAMDDMIAEGGPVIVASECVADHIWKLARHFTE